MDIKEEVKEILLSHRGKNEAITSQEISDKLGGVDNLDSTPRTREVIRNLVKEEGLPVAATSTGYFIIETQDELNEYITNLTVRANEIKERRDAVINAVDEEEMPIQQNLTQFQ